MVDETSKTHRAGLQRVFKGKRVLHLGMEQKLVNFTLPPAPLDEPEMAGALAPFSKAVARR